MSLLDWTLLAVALVTGLYWYLTRHHDYWKSVGVPTMPGVLPGVGNMWDAFVFKASSSRLFSDFYKHIRNQPAIGMYEFRTPTLLLGSLDLIQDVLVKEFSSFHDNVLILDPSIDKHISRNPFIVKGDRWKSLRQRLNPAFSSVKIKAMFPLIERVCQEFNNYMEKHVNEDIDITNVTGLFTSEVVAKCAFGLDGNAFTAQDSGEFFQKGRQMWDNTLYNPVMVLIMMYFPIVNKILRKSFVPEEVTKFFVGLVTQAEEYRTKNPDKVPEDYLQYLLNLKKKDPEFTIDDVVAQSLTFFTDGFETTSIIASFVIHELTVNPDIQEAVRQEVKSMESFSYENIVSLDLLERVIKEAIRKYGAFALIKLCTKDYILQSNGHTYPVKKGQNLTYGVFQKSRNGGILFGTLDRGTKHSTLLLDIRNYFIMYPQPSLGVAIPLYAIHNDPKHYPDPEKFDPDRFLPDAVKSRHPMSFLGFGGGPRMCIGSRFATTQLKVFLANMLTNFRLLKCGKTDEHVTLSPVQIMPVSENGLWCQFQKL